MNISKVIAMIRFFINFITCFQIDQLLFALQQGLEIGKRPVGRRRLLLVARRCRIMPLFIQISRVLIVVAVDTQQFPVTAVRGIIIMVVIPVMDRKFTKSFACEFTSTPRADPRENLKRSLTIGILPTLPVAPGSGNYLIQPVVL